MKLSDLAHYLTKADRGDKEAQYLVGLYYLEPPESLQPPLIGGNARSLLEHIGTFTPDELTPELLSDREEAYKWLLKAASQDHALAQNKLGDLFYYHSGDGGGPDMTRAVKWYKKAAANGLREGQYNYGRCLIEGDGVKQDEKEGLKLLAEAARNGHAPAYTLLADILAEGRLTPLNIARAFTLYQKGLTLGHGEAGPKIVHLLSIGTTEIRGQKMGVTFPDGSFIELTPQKKAPRNKALPKPAAE